MNTTPSRILIVRLSAIGDVVHGLPVLNALRAALPDAHIAWLVESRAAELLRGHPSLDEHVELPRGWLKSPSAVLRLRNRLRASRFDVAVDLQGLTKSALAAWLSGAKTRIGFGGAAGREISRWLNNTLVEPSGTHVIDRNLDLLHPLGIHKPAVRFELCEHARDGHFAESVIEAGNLSSGCAVINPGAGWASKLWPAERFGQVAAHLGRRHRLPSLVVWGGARERALADAVVAASAGQAVVAPSTTLLEMAALARRAHLFIASDTGPLHIAAAVGTPCVGLYGPMPAERNGPYGPEHVSLQAMKLEGGSRRRRSAGPESMLAISVGSVCAACDEILSRPATQRRCA